MRFTRRCPGADNSCESFVCYGREIDSGSFSSCYSSHFNINFFIWDYFFHLFAFRCQNEKRESTPLIPSPEQDNDNEKLFNYCCAFSTIFTTERDAKEKKAFRAEVDLLVYHGARMRREASHLANFILLSQCEAYVQHRKPFTIAINSKSAWVQFYLSCLFKVCGDITGIKISQNMESNRKAEHKLRQDLQESHLEATRMEVELEKHGFSLEGHKCEMEDIRDMLDSNDIKPEERIQMTEDFLYLEAEHKASQSYRDLLEKGDEIISSFERKNVHRIQSEIKTHHSDYLNRLDWKPSHHDYSSFLETPGYKSIRDIIAKEMAINAITSLWKNMFQRQKNALRALISDTALVDRMIILINCPQNKMNVISAKWKAKIEHNAKQPKETKYQRIFRESFHKLDDDAIQEIIRNHRNWIRDFDPARNNTSITENYSKRMSNTPILLRYFYYLLGPLTTARAQRMLHVPSKEMKTTKDAPSFKASIPLDPFASKSKVFHLLPLHGVSLFCIQIQLKTLKAITKRIGCERLIDEKDETQIWNNWFDFKSSLRIPTNRPLQFTRRLVTDGIKVSCPFQEVDNLATKLVKRSRKPTPVKLAAFRDEKKNIETPATKIRFRPGDKGIFADKTARLDSDSGSFKLTAVDPGRHGVVTVLDYPYLCSQEEPYRGNQDRDAKHAKECNHLNTIFRKDDGKEAQQVIETKKPAIRNFTSGEFYHWRRIDVIRNRLRKHKEKFMHSDPRKEKDMMQVGQYNFRTKSSAEFKSSWESQIPIEETLWEFYGRKIHRRWRFESFKAKQSTERKICLRILGLPEKRRGLRMESVIPTIVAYGDGSFKTNVRGSRTTPVKSIPKRLSQFPNVTVVMTNEFRTSVTCHRCKTRMKKKMLWTWKRTRLKCIRIKNGRLVKKANHTLVHEKCFKVLHCAQQCPNANGIHRDINACYNIAEVCHQRLWGKKMHARFSRKKTFSKTQAN